MTNGVKQNTPAYRVEKTSKRERRFRIERSSARKLAPCYSKWLAGFKMDLDKYLDVKFRLDTRAFRESRVCLGSWEKTNKNVTEFNS